MFNLLFVWIFTDQGSQTYSKIKAINVGFFKYRSNFILMAKLWKRESIRTNKKPSISILKYKIHFFITFALSLHMHIYIRFQSMVHIHSYVTF